MPSSEIGRNLVVADGEPGAAGADQETVHAGLMDQRNQRRVPNPADAPMFQVVDRQVEQFGEVQKCFRHVAVPRVKLVVPPNMTHRGATRQ